MDLHLRTDLKNTAFYFNLNIYGRWRHLSLSGSFFPIGLSIGWTGLKTRRFRYKDDESDTIYKQRKVYSKSCAIGSR